MTTQIVQGSPEYEILVLANHQNVSEFNSGWPSHTSQTICKWPGAWGQKSFLKLYGPVFGSETIVTAELEVA